MPSISAARIVELSAGIIRLLTEHGNGVNPVVDHSQTRSLTLWARASGARKVHGTGFQHLTSRSKPSCDPARRRREAAGNSSPRTRTAPSLIIRSVTTLLTVATRMIV